jgi:2-polyprenyl-6-methoxyphenol hydroxylase-like FAD-dependent oxidoreductase
LLRELGEENMRLGATCSGFEQDEEGRNALFVDGSEERGDALIGADGLNSTIRTSLFGGEKPRYAGYTAWRAVVEPSHELLPWGVGERSEVRLRPHRRGHSLLVRHQKRSRT